MREVEAALAGEEEFAADGRHGVVEIDFDAGATGDFGCHQTGGAAADDG
jgi:hypothetical protein